MKDCSKVVIVWLFAQMIFSGKGFANPREEKDSTRIFYLGEIVVTGIQDGLITPFNQNYILELDLNRSHSMDASRALNLLPGLSLSNVGGRNESMVFVRGFDLRHVPVYLDGVPEYIPFDGYVDLARFTTFDLSKITVAKGFSSVLYGADALGGAINLVTRKPETSLDYNVSAGIMSESGYNYSLNLGTNQILYYLEGSASRLKQNSFPLSKSFTSLLTEDGGERDNSYRKDSKYSIKAGFAPNETDEYSFSFISQQSEKGNPVYAGHNPAASIRFWRWPQWDKTSEYFITKTVLGDDNVLIKSRFFHDKFANIVSAYDDATYFTQLKKSSFRSIYDDDTWGSVLEATTKMFQHQKLTASFHWKHDIHREHNVGEPIRTDRDATLSFGLEDVYRLSDELSIIGGASYNFRKSLQAQDYNSKTKTISNFVLDNSDAWNMQLGGIYPISENRELSFSVAKKTRFATMKDRYSYKLNTAIPNPDLKPEMAINYDLSYRHKIVNCCIYNLSLFYNDVRNVIQQVNNVQGNLSQMQNLGKARYFGGEAELSVRPASQIDISMNYTLLKRENISNPSVKFLDTPEHKFAAGLKIIPIEPIEIQGSMEYDSKRFSTSDGIYTADDYAIFNINASLFINKNLEMNAGIQNLFDRNYSLVEGYPEAGRSGYLTLRFHN